MEEYCTFSTHLLIGGDVFEKQLSIEKVVIVGIRIIYCNYFSQHKCTVCAEIIRGFPTDTLYVVLF